MPTARQRRSCRCQAKDIIARRNARAGTEKRGRTQLAKNRTEVLQVEPFQDLSVTCIEMPTVELASLYVPPCRNPSTVVSMRDKDCRGRPS